MNEKNYSLSDDERLDYINEDLSLIQLKRGLTFGTDAYLLSAFVRERSGRGADLGSGTGVASLLCLTKNKSSVLMYPEAVYTLDGTCVTIPSTLAKFIKMLEVPLCFIKTNGVYLHAPAYGYLDKRDVPICAELRYVLSPEEIKKMSVEEIQTVLDREFSYDDFRWQKENNVVIDEPFRAEGLHNILYKCPHCKTEGKMKSSGIHLSCDECGKVWELTELGYLKATEGETYFDHVPDWYKWERECVHQDILDGTYGFDVP
jgi:hypothetical protein